MDPLRILCETQGFFTRAEAAGAGYADRDVTRMVRGRVWHRIRRGYYTYADLWAELDEVGRHAVRSLAVAHSLGPAVALSHVSAAILHGVSVWNVDLTRVHVTRLDGGAGRTEGDVVHHEGLCLDDDVTELAGHRIIVADRARRRGRARGRPRRRRSSCSSPALHHELCDVDMLRARFELMAPWPFMRHLHVPVRMARPGSESIGETPRLLALPGLPPARTEAPVRGLRRRRRPEGDLRLGLARAPACSASSTVGSSTAGCSSPARSRARSSSPRSGARTCCAS